MTQKKGERRLAVEAVMQRAKRPLSAKEIGDLAALPVTLARVYIGHCCMEGMAHNTNPESRGNALYLWGPPKVQDGNAAPARNYVAEGSYKPAPIYTRPGSQDHLACLSRRGEEFVEHRGPISIAGSL